MTDAAIMQRLHLLKLDLQPDTPVRAESTRQTPARAERPAQRSVQRPKSVRGRAGPALAVAAVMGLALAAYSWWSPSAESEPSAGHRPAATPAAVPAGLNRNVGGLVASGFVVAEREATVGAPMIATIKQILVREGQSVRKGQVLAILDDGAASAQVDRAAAQTGAAAFEIADLAAQRAQARSDLDRKAHLGERGFVTRAELESARARLASLDAQIGGANASLAASRAAANAARRDLSRYVIRAPFAGVIVSQNAEVGEIVSPASAGGFTRTGILTLIDLGSLQVDVDVNEAHLGQLRTGQAVRLSLEAFPGETFSARLRSIVPTVDRSRATVKVRLDLLDRDPRIIPQMAVRATFVPLGEVK